MAAQLVYPTNFELNAILQALLPQLILDDPLFSGKNPLFPIETSDYAKIQWELLDSFYGLTQLRGIDGQPGRVNMVGLNTYEMDPGYYGDVMTISEKDMTLWRKPGDPNAPWQLADLISRRQEFLLTRAVSLIRAVIWLLASTGTFSIASPSGIIHTDTFPLQTYSTVHPWSALTTSTPLADNRNVKVLHRGFSVRFDSNATEWMNLVTFNYLDANANTSDLFGRRMAGLETIEGLENINKIMLKDDLPKISVIDDGYLSAPFPGNTGAPPFTPYLANGIAVVIGQRPGKARLGRAIFTRNAATLNEGRQGDGIGDLMDSPYAGLVMKIVDKGEIMAVGREIDMGLGFNWGPAIEYPSAVVAMNVAAGS